MNLTLTAKKHLGSSTWSYIFTPKQPLSWQAGQFVRVEVPHRHPDAKGATRRFTIAGAPHEHYITITTRITPTSFKQALAELKIGQSITLLDPPAGDFTWQPAAVQHLFIAQGIGITPFYAIIKNRLHRKLPVNARLIYVTHPGHEILFVHELQSWAATDPTLQLQLQSHTATPSEIAASVPDITKHLVYVSGPKSLLALCLPPYNLPLSHLLQDNFPGYQAENY